jgi:cytochrome c553
MNSRGRLPVFIGALATILTCSAEPKSPEAEQKPYRVVDGKVDESTYLGWRAFHSACHACHGVDATGTVQHLSPRFSCRESGDLCQWLRATVGVG